MSIEETIKEKLEPVATDISEKLEQLIFFPFDFLVQAETKIVETATDIAAKAVTTIGSSKTVELAKELAPEIPGLIAAMPKTTARLARTIKEALLYRIRETLHNVSTIPQETRTQKEGIHEHRTQTQDC